jgi:hypothetical protein
MLTYFDAILLNKITESQNLHKMHFSSVVYMLVLSTCVVTVYVFVDTVNTVVRTVFCRIGATP